MVEIQNFKLTFYNIFTILKNSWTGKILERVDFLDGWIYGRVNLCGWCPHNEDGCVEASSIGLASLLSLPQLNEDGLCIELISVRASAANQRRPSSHVTTSDDVSKPPARAAGANNAGDHWPT